MTGWQKFRKSPLYPAFLACLIVSGAMTGIGGIRYAYFNTDTNDPAYLENLKQYVITYPQLYPEAEKALSDGVLTIGEYRSIVEKRGEELNKIARMNQIRAEIKPKEQK